MKGFYVTFGVKGLWVLYYNYDLMQHFFFIVLLASISIFTLQPDHMESRKNFRIWLFHGHF